MRTTKSILALAVCAVAMVFVSCSKDDDKYTIEELEDYNYKHVAIKRVTDYVFELDNNDYYTKYYFNPYSAGGSFNGVAKWHGACAGVRNGDFFGRNLDWSCSEQPEFVVRIPAGKDRHASLGVCATGMVKQIDKNQTWVSQMLANDISDCCYDGVNDCGVCMVVLVVHYIDIDKVGQPSVKEGTNPSAATSIHGSNVVRYVLDKASSAAQAVELLKAVNIYGSLEDYSFHWLLCDEKENYFVECAYGELRATKVEENAYNPEYTKPMLTNFYMTKKLDEQVYPGGVERYEILKENYDMTNTAEGMFNALEKLRFSRKYDGKDPSTLNGEKDPNFYSEYVLSMPNYQNLLAGTISKKYPRTDAERQEVWDDLIKWDIAMNSFPAVREKGLNPRQNNLSSWTCHTSVYNIKGRTMQLVNGEEYNNVLPSATTSFQIIK